MPPRVFGPLGPKTLRGQILPALRFQRDQINSLQNGRDSDLKQNENAFKDPEDGFGRKTVQGIDTLAGNSEVYQKLEASVVQLQLNS